MGIRSLGLPVVCAIWGQVAGPTWGLLLASDYRIAASATNFTLPLWGPLECLSELLGRNVATELCMNHGPVSALNMLELGVLHQCQKQPDEAQQAASEMAKRIASFPNMACRQTMALLSPAAEKYATVVG